MKKEIICYPDGNIINISDDQLTELLNEGLVFLDDEWTKEKPNGQYGFNKEDEAEILAILTTPAPSTSVSVPAEQIKKEVYRAYVEDGQSAAFEVANKHNVDYEFCKACDCDSPVIDHECLICGQPTATPAPSNNSGEELDESLMAKDMETFVDKLEGSEGYKHTQGKWVVDGLAVDSPQFEICVVSKGFDPDGNQMKYEEAAANAALIASAPSLLKQNQQQAKDIERLAEALKSVVSELGKYLDAADDQFGREENEPYQKATELLNRIK